MTTLQAKMLIDTDDDFVYSKRHDYSLDELRRRHPEGCSNRLIAAVLLITEDDVEARYESIVKKLRDHMRVGVEDE